MSEQVDITKIPEEELKKDLGEARQDAQWCRLGLKLGITVSSHGGSVEDRLTSNRKQIAVIKAELIRRGVL